MQTLTDLMAAPSDQDRKAFAAVSGALPTLRPGDFALIRRALAHYETAMHAESGRQFIASQKAKATDSKLARELAFISERHCDDAFDARELADRLAAKP